MCTAVTYKTKDLYFGRTLDYEFSYGEKIVVVPRNYKLEFTENKTLENHYAIIGTAHVVDNYPLFYDAANEKGLAMAGLNFVGNACYFDPVEGKNNVAQFEFIPYILSSCSSVDEARKVLENINITKRVFNEQMPIGQLHWMIADKENCIVAESVADGLKIYDDPVGVLTNNPPFDMQMFRLNDFAHLSVTQPKNNFSENSDEFLSIYSRGMGAIGLPGDLSSQSRFVRAAFVKLNSRSGDTENESVSQFFHILGSVDQQRGCCEVNNGKYEITIYTCCYNVNEGVYYYTTYDKHQISAIDMKRENLESEELICYDMLSSEVIDFQN